MAVTDWLPTISGTILGLAGVYATVRAGKRQQDTALQTAAVAAEAQRKLAAQDRHQRRIEAMYAEVANWARSLQESLWKAQHRIEFAEPGESVGNELVELVPSTDQALDESSAYLWSEKVRLITIALGKLHYEARAHAIQIRLWEATEPHRKDEIEELRHRLAKMHTECRQRVEALWSELHKELRAIEYTESSSTD